MRRVLQFLAIVALSGCFGNEETTFPEGLEPLEENTLPPPMGTAADPFPERIDLVGTHGAQYDTIMGRGYVSAPLAETWAAYQNPAVGADRRTSPDWTSTPLDDPMYTASYVIHHVTTVVVTVEWDVTWRHGLVTGTADAPELVAIRFQKTDGSTLISLIEGSILLRPANDGAATEVELVYHASAASSGVPEYTEYMQDLYDDAVAVVHGDPLPVY
jgi:hypothetical protein